MGACRDNPTAGSLGSILLHQHRKSPQYLSYVIPLLVEQDFCTVLKDKKSIIIRKSIALQLTCQQCGNVFSAAHKRQVPLCQPCAEERRSKRQGPIQSRRREQEVDFERSKLNRVKSTGQTNKLPVEPHNRPRITIEKFAADLPTWYLKYTESQYFAPYKDLEARLSQKAFVTGYLEKRDLFELAVWGGDEKRHGLGTNICSNNTDTQVELATKRAIQHINSPRDALMSLFSIKYVKLAYASKTLRCISPQYYVACDRHTRRACEDLALNIDDNDIESMIAGYLWFIEICRRIKEKVKVPGPRPGDLWFLADIEMALFQFAYPPSNGKLMKS